jgi:hypothetical protein
LPRGFVGHVGLQLGRLKIDIDDAPTVADQASRGRLTDARGGPGDDRDAF